MALTDPQIEHYGEARRLAKVAENQGHGGTRKILATLAATHATLATVVATAAEAASADAASAGGTP